MSNLESFLDMLLQDARAHLAQAQQELQGGHNRLNGCAGGEATKGLPLYERISKEIEQLCHERDEKAELAKALSCEIDHFRALARVAEHKRLATEHHAILVERKLTEERAVLRADLREALGLKDV